MNNVRIETLTPVHIGSGVNYEQNRDYLYFDQERNLAVVLPKLLLGVISGGQKILPEDISRWITAIDNRESLLPFLNQRKPGLKASDVGKRVVKVTGSAPISDKPMREQIHGGNDQPYIPGASLKGSIRTALLDRLIKADNGGFVKNIDNLKDRRNNYNADQLEQHYFGKDPNHDVLRLLQVGDCYFDHTVCLYTTVINGKRDGWETKHSISQFVEAIPQGAVSNMKLLHNTTLQANIEQHKVRARGRDKQHEPPYFLFGNKKTLTDMLPFKTLFKHINDHTAAIIESELEYWNTENNPEPLGNYLEHIEDLLAKINTAQPNECILRLGWGTGFLNMTGDWQYWFMDRPDYDDLVDALRKGKYGGMVFPKTRRLIEGGQPLGYVRLTLS